MRLARILAAAVCVVALAAVLSACGGSSDSGDSGSTGGTAADTSTAASGGGVPEQVTADVQKWLQRPTSIGIDKPLQGSIPKGKTVYWLQCSSPACVALTGYLKPAIQAVGWDLKVINAGLTPETVKAAWHQAVVDKPDAVIGSGFSRALYEPELQKLASMNIPVLNMTTADPPVNGYAAAFDYGPDYLAGGKRLAEYALSKSGTDINAATITASAFANLGFVAKGFKQTIQKYCPDCPVDGVDVPATSVGSDLPTRVATYLQAHPDVNWVYIGFADMMVGVPAALKSAGITRDVKFVTIDTNPTTSTYLKEGDYLAAVDGFPNPEIMWRCVDFLLRYFNHESTAQTTAHTLPVWLITGENVPSTTEGFPLVADYQEQYKKLWGLG